MATNQPQDDYQKTALRLPRPLHADIVQSAQTHGRSMNAEIVDRLELSFSAEAALSDAANALGEMKATLTVVRDVQRLHSVIDTQSALIKVLGGFVEDFASKYTNLDAETQTVLKFVRAFGGAARSGGGGAAVTVAKEYLELVGALPALQDNSAAQPEDDARETGNPPV